MRVLNADGTPGVVFSDGLAVGYGARSFADGIDAVYFVGQQNMPVEFAEADYPFRVERYALHCDSGGPGRFRYLLYKDVNRHMKLGSFQR